MTNDLTFGQFISEQRQKHSMESQELAKALGISGAYLSQLERGVRTNPSAELLDKIAVVLCLNKIETETLYDLYAKVSGQISPDLAVYVSSSETVRQALRTARDANATEEDWKQFIVIAVVLAEQLKSRRTNKCE